MLKGFTVDPGDESVADLARAVLAAAWREDPGWFTRCREDAEAWIDLAGV